MYYLAPPSFRSGGAPQPLVQYMPGRPDQHSTTASFIPSHSRPELALHIHLARRLCGSTRGRCKHTWVAGAGWLARQPWMRQSRRFCISSPMSITQRVQAPIFMSLDIDVSCALGVGRRCGRAWSVLAATNRFNLQRP